MDKNECKHNFFVIKTDADSEPTGRIIRNSSHCMVGCAWCGQVRKIYQDGIVKVTVHKGQIKYEV